MEVGANGNLGLGPTSACLSWGCRARGGGLYYAEGLSRKVRQAWLQWPRHTLWFRYLLGLVVINSLDPFSLPFGYILMEV